MSKGACRRAFTRTLKEIAQENRRIIVLTSDARGSVTLGDYVDALSDQFVEVGIAEQNEVGVAAGMASCGLIPFVCAPAPFLSARAVEQIKTDVSYSNTNVKICGVSGGISYGPLGATHYSIYDIATFRSMTNMTIMLPADDAEAAWMTRAIAEHVGPVYMRMGRNEVEAVYTQQQTKQLRIGKAFRLIDGSDLTIIANGELLYDAKYAAKLLAEDGISARLLDMHTVKPLDCDAVIQAAEETGAILTVEEHSIYGGLGSAVAECVCQSIPVPMKLLGLPDKHIIAGKSAEVFAHYGLDAPSIAGAAKLLLERKK